VSMTSPVGTGQLEQIMGGTNHRPLASDFIEASQQELPDTRPFVEQVPITGTCC
jgi:hypothetical protein